MKFLLDVCVSSRSLTAFLIAQRHDVISAIAIDPRASDVTLIEHALREDRVLITEDKDFGELIFVQGNPHGPLVRLVKLSVDEQVEAVRELLETHPADLTGAVIITISRGRIRIRRRNG
jgi:predicted nuclease of predicted toxin-antitoxin system